MRVCIGCLSIALLAGCTEVPAKPDVVRRAATIEFYGDSAHFEVPAFAQLNSPFTVSFRAYGGGCVSKAQNDVTTSSSKAEIRSYQDVLQADFCTDELRVETHTITITFTALGVGHVVLYGQKQPGDTPVVLDRAVNVGIP